MYYVLEREGTLSQGQLAAETRLSKRTVRFAVSKLTDADLVEEGLCLKDARKSVYAVADAEVDGEDAATTMAQG